MAPSPPATCSSSVRIDWNRHYVSYRGTDGKLYVCWWGGSSYLSGSFTLANCSAPSSIDGDNIYGTVFPDRNNGYCWYKGTDNKLYVCWYGGGTWNVAAVTGANCAGSIFVDHNTHYVLVQGPTASSTCAGGVAPAISMDRSPPPIASAM